ncbi:MAG TPA: invasion associated locus B family protein [Methylosinus sp.]|uniref:invasion associated locus B family protein n=1 Tax=Methylosinus sp. TaxID=427 RepID=UPI002F957DFD
MPMQFPRIVAAVLTGVFLVSAGAAQAQQKPPAHKPAAPAQAPTQAPAPAPAPAQQQAPQGPIKADLVPVQPEWTKVCGADQQTKKEICYTTRDFGAQADQPLLALAVYDPKGDDSKIIRLLLPPGLLLKPGFRFAVGAGALEAGEFEICFPNGCFAQAKVKAALIDQMKKADKMTIIVKNQVNNEVTFLLPLSGFGKSYDGPPVDPKVLEEQQKKLQDELQKKADEERKKLESQPKPAGK